MKRKLRIQLGLALMVIAVVFALLISVNIVNSMPRGGGETTVGTVNDRTELKGGRTKRRCRVVVEYFVDGRAYRTQSANLGDLCEGTTVTVS